MQQIQAAGAAAQQDEPRRGILKDAEKLEHRLTTLYGVLQRDVVRPIPAPGDAERPLGPAARALVRGARRPLRTARASRAGRPWRKVNREILYNRVNPSRIAWIVLLAALVASIAAWARSSRLLDAVSFGLLVLGFAAMTLGDRDALGRGGADPGGEHVRVAPLPRVGRRALRRRRLRPAEATGAVVLNAAAMSALTMALTDLLPMDRFIHPIAAGPRGHAVARDPRPDHHGQLRRPRARPRRRAHAGRLRDLRAGARRARREAVRAPLLVHARRVDLPLAGILTGSDLGRLVVGPLLGLGPEGGLVARRLPRLHGDPPR